MPRAANNSLGGSRRSFSTQLAISIASQSARGKKSLAVEEQGWVAIFERTFATYSTFKWST